MLLKKNLIKYRMIEKHMELVKAGKYEEGRSLLRLLRNHSLRVGIGDDAAFIVELIAEECGCHVRYSRNYNVTHVTW